MKMIRRGFAMMFLVGVVGVGIVFVGTIIHDDTDLVAQAEQKARIELDELGARLDKAIPRYRGITVDPRDAFDLLDISRLDKSGATVKLRDIHGKMFCTGDVTFADGPNSGHRDILVVSKCYSTSQEPRVFEGGMPQKHSIPF